MKPRKSIRDYKTSTNLPGPAMRTQEDVNDPQPNDPQPGVVRYSATQSPPDFQMAENHKESCTMRKKAKNAVNPGNVCPCCNHLYNTPKLTMMDEIEEYKRYDGALFLYFFLIKELSFFCSLCM